MRHSLLLLLSACELGTLEVVGDDPAGETPEDAVDPTTDDAAGDPTDVAPSDEPDPGEDDDEPGAGTPDEPELATWSGSISWSYQAGPRRCDARLETTGEEILPEDLDGFQPCQACERIFLIRWEDTQDTCGQVTRGDERPRGLTARPDGAVDLFWWQPTGFFGQEAAIRVGTARPVNATATFEVERDQGWGTEQYTEVVEL
jgi:hypothetical protein